MLCSIYKTNKKEGMYLFVAKRGDFSAVPETLLEMFGQPKLVVTMNLTPERELAFAESVKVIEEVTQSGFYLQIPPPPVNHLDEYKKWRAELKGK